MKSRYVTIYEMKESRHHGLFSLGWTFACEVLLCAYKRSQLAGDLLHLWGGLRGVILGRPQHVEVDLDVLVLQIFNRLKYHQGAGGYRGLVLESPQHVDVDLDVLILQIFFYRNSILIFQMTIKRLKAPPWGRWTSRRRTWRTKAIYIWMGCFGTLCACVRASQNLNPS